MDTITKRYVNVKDASIYTSISVKTLYEWGSAGKIPSIKVSNKRLFDLKDLDKFMESLKGLSEDAEKVTKRIIEKVLN